MVDKFYPVAPVASKETEVLDEAVEAAGILAQMEAGEDNDIVLISKQLAGRNCFGEMKAIYNKVIKEQKDLKAISIAECKTQTEYVAKLAEKAVHADPVKWLAGVKASELASTWTALKTIYPTPVVDVVKEVVAK